MAFLYFISYDYLPSVYSFVVSDHGIQHVSVPMIFEIISSIAFSSAFLLSSIFGENENSISKVTLFNILHAMTRILVVMENLS